jgi:competence protein ComEC
MALIALIAQMVGRQNYSLLALAATIWIMLMIDPDLIANVGFQLSVSASAGIIVIKPLIDRIFYIAKLLQEDFSTTLAAQCASLPILLSAFGGFAPLSILVNILVLWTIPIVMILGLLAALGSVIHPLLAVPFAYGAYPFLVYFLGVVRVLERFITPIQVDDFSSYLTISYYMFLLSFIIFMRPKQHE